MSTSLSAFARPLLANPIARGLISSPVVIWEHRSIAGPTPPNSGLPRSPRTDEAEVLTGAAVAGDRPQPGEPLVFEIKKGTRVGNAFAMGVTVGRTPNNDVCIPDDSISRFHGYFQKDEKTDLWTIIDVGSRNGILAGGVRLASDKAHFLAAREQLVIGSVPLLFLVPGMLFKYIDALL